jgi:uncharacterized protein (DUF1697 family)
MMMIALLRGINVGGYKKVPMSELCALATKVGFTKVCSYINSGNLVFEAGKLKSNQVEGRLEKAIEKQFGFHVDVIVRTATQWKKYASGSPFPNAERSRPNFLHLGLSKLPCSKDLLTKLSERATLGEKIKLEGGAIWVDFLGGAGKSKLTPVLFDKIAGSPVTMRNWNTVQKLVEVLEEKSSDPHSP